MFIVTQDTGGSGLFYYAVAAIQTPIGYKTTQAFFLGDRIAPQPTHIDTDSKEIYVNFAERGPKEAMTTPPSIGITIPLIITPEGILKRALKY